MEFLVYLECWLSTFLKLYNIWLLYLEKNFQMQKHSEDWDMVQSVFIPVNSYI